MSDRGSHATDLPVPALSERKAQPAVRYGFAHSDWRGARPEPLGLGNGYCFTRMGRAIFERETPAQSAEAFGARAPFDLDAICFGPPKPGAGDPRLQGSVIGQHKQSFTVPVQSACGVDAWQVNEVRQCCARTVGISPVCELAEYAKGFVEQDRRHRAGLACLEAARRGVSLRREHESGARDEILAVQV